MPKAENCSRIVIVWFSAFLLLKKIDEVVGTHLICCIVLLTICYSDSIWPEHLKTAHIISGFLKNTATVSSLSTNYGCNIISHVVFAGHGNQKRPTTCPCIKQLVPEVAAPNKMVKSHWPILRGPLESLYQAINFFLSILSPPPEEETLSEPLKNLPIQTL